MGFDHAGADVPGARAHERDLVGDVRQYRHRHLTGWVRLGHIDYGTGNVEEGEWTSVSFVATGTCHAVLVWVEYDLWEGGGDDDDDGGKPIRVSTESGPYHQIVRLLAE